MTLVELLRRLRRHGVPGAALAAGVPADLRAEIASELEPVFRALEPTVELTRRMRASATDDCDRMVQSAVRDSVRILRDARRQAPDVAAAETSAQLQQLEGERRQLLAEAEDQAEQVTTVATSRSPQLVERIIQVTMGLPRSGARS